MKKNLVLASLFAVTTTIGVLARAQRSRTSSSSYKGEFSLDCKQWSKTNANSLMSAGEQPTLFVRRLTADRGDNPGYYIRKDRMLTVSSPRGIEIMSVIPEGFVGVSTDLIVFKELKSNALDAGLRGLTQGVALFQTKPDGVQSFAFSHESGNAKLHKIIQANGKKYVLDCSVATACRLTTDGIEISLKPKGAGRVLLRQNKSITPQLLDSVDRRCRLAIDKEFQKKVDESILQLTTSCADFHNKKIVRPDFAQFETACGQWRDQLREQLESLR